MQYISQLISQTVFLVKLNGRHLWIMLVLWLPVPTLALSVPSLDLTQFRLDSLTSLSVGLPAYSPVDSRLPWFNHTISPTPMNLTCRPAMNGWTLLRFRNKQIEGWASTHHAHDCCLLSLQVQMNIIGPDPLDENLDQKNIQIAELNNLSSISNHPNINKLSDDLSHASFHDALLISYHMLHYSLTG